MPKHPELTDVDVYAHDFPNKMKILDMNVRRTIRKGQYANLIFPALNRRCWVKMVGIMDGGLVGELQEDLTEGLHANDRIFFQYRHIWDMRDGP